MHKLIEMRIELNRLHKQLNSLFTDKGLYKGDREYDALVKRIESLEDERNALYYTSVDKAKS